MCALPLTVRWAASPAVLLSDCRADSRDGLSRPFAEGFGGQGKDGRCSDHALLQEAGPDEQVQTLAQHPDGQDTGEGAGDADCPAQRRGALMTAAAIESVPVFSDPKGDKAPLPAPECDWFLDGLSGVTVLGPMLNKQSIATVDANRWMMQAACPKRPLCIC